MYVYVCCYMCVYIYIYIYIYICMCVRTQTHTIIKCNGTGFLVCDKGSILVVMNKWKMSKLNSGFYSDCPVNVIMVYHFISCTEML